MIDNDKYIWEEKKNPMKSKRNGMLPGKLAEKGQNKSKQPDLLPTFRIYYVKYD